MRRCWYQLGVFFIALRTNASPDALSPDDYLEKGDLLLSHGDNEQAIGMYKQGIQVMENDQDDTYSLTTKISMYTNLATALSAEEKNEDAANFYQQALLSYQQEINEIVDPAMKQEITLIVAQAAFFLGMVYQDLGVAQDAADAYQYAFELDPLHWSAMANLGAVYHDLLSKHDQALLAYNKAYNILINASDDEPPTDPPPEPRYILSQLQYRIGLCLSHDKNKKCALNDAPTRPVDCQTMAAHAFSLAMEYDDTNEAAKHMLASITADATIERASNKYVKSLFDEYAKNFEESLVGELGYTGYERLRRGFDRAMAKKGEALVDNQLFDLVVDAGCGTGLVGEQFRNISKRMIGVDLSQAILDQAKVKRPGLYDEMIAGDVMQAFRKRAAEISLIIAGDSYIYFGDLEPLFAAMQEGLAEGGYAAFTLENVDIEAEYALTKSAKPNWRWQLTASGRFAHRKEYVSAVAQAHQLQPLHYEAMDGFRFERGVGVRGHLFVVLKQSGSRNEEL